MHWIAQPLKCTQLMLVDLKGENGKDQPFLHLVILTFPKQKYNLKRKHRFTKTLYFEIFKADTVFKRIQSNQLDRLGYEHVFISRWTRLRDTFRTSGSGTFFLLRPVRSMKDPANETVDSLRDRCWRKQSSSVQLVEATAVDFFLWTLGNIFIKVMYIWNEFNLKELSIHSRRLNNEQALWNCWCKLSFIHSTFKIHKFMYWCLVLTIPTSSGSCWQVLSLIFWAQADRIKRLVARKAEMTKARRWPLLCDIWDRTFHPISWTEKKSYRPF